MKEFFDKYGSGSKEPYHALEMIIEKLFKIKEKVERGDGNIVNDLSSASTMLDDFALSAKTSDFKPREYHNIQGHPQHGPHNNYDTIRMDDRLGYRQAQDHYYPMYPIYPFFNEDRQGMPRRDVRPGERDYNPYPEQSEAYRRNYNRPHER